MAQQVYVNKYKLLSKIGEGMFGSVYKGSHKKTNKLVAIKCENINSPFKLLKNESHILKYLYDHGCRSIPLVHWYGIHNDYTCLIIPHYDCTLTEYLCNETFTKDKLNKIFVRLIGMFENIHTNMVIHRDVKPDNFMIKDGNIYLIDFGFSVFYIQEDGIHIENEISDTIIGTPKYVSYNIHCGDTSSRRDDLISLGYVYLYMLMKELPWDTLPNTVKNDNYDTNHIEYHRNQSIREYKKIEHIDTLRHLIGEEITMFLGYCYYIKYDVHPEYNALKDIFL
jgi:serine/threonine protein kinase